MKRTFLCITILLSASVPAALGQRDRLANAGKAGLNVRSLDDVLRLPEEHIDLATAALIASEYWSDMVAGRRYLEQLDTMALEIQARLRQQRLVANSRAIPVISPSRGPGPRPTRR